MLRFPMAQPTNPNIAKAHSGLTWFSLLSLIRSG
jgi:hypothetical protein